MAKSPVVAALLLGVAIVAAPGAAAMSEIAERLGNQPIEWDPDWPGGVWAVANLECRVLYRCVTSGMVMARDEEFFYEGDAEQLNEALALFAEIAADRHEVVLLPGAPTEDVWTRDEAVPYDWKLHVPGAYLRQEARKEKGTEVRSRCPNMTVHVGGWVDLEQIEVPHGVAVLGLGDLTARYVKGLTSDDRSIRYQAASRLGTVAPYADGAVAPLVAALEDEYLYVRMAAADSLGKFGLRASDALPKLRDLLKDEELDPGPRRTLSEAATRIEGAEELDAERYRDELARIEAFRRSTGAGEAPQAAL